MEDIVAETLKIIDDDGDSFAQRAEMYYRKIPELLKFVEEAFRAYRALAEKYDEDEDDDDDRNVPKTNSTSADSNNRTEKQNIPKVPDIPKKDFRSPSMLLSRKGPMKRNASSKKSISTTQSSGLSKVEALAEIDKLQKDILALQTEKEFVRSLYEKYCEIEDKITEMQKRVCSLQEKETEPKCEDEEEIASFEEEMDEYHMGISHEKIEEKVEEDLGNSLSMTEIAERIDELVTKFVSLETAVTSQTGLVNRLRSEADEL